MRRIKVTLYVPDEGNIHHDVNLEIEGTLRVLSENTCKGAHRNIKDPVYTDVIVGSVTAEYVERMWE